MSNLSRLAAGVVALLIAGAAAACPTGIKGKSAASDKGHTHPVSSSAPDKQS